MGNVCCIGRTHPPQPTPSKPPKVVKKHKEPNKQLLEIKTSPESRELEPNFFVDDEGSQEYDDDEEEERFNTVKVFSRKSEARDSLDYELITAEDLSIQQQKQVIKALDKFKDMLEADEQEMVDGFVHVVGESSLMMMITTHALYLLNPTDLADVQRRVQLEDIVLIIIEKGFGSVGFVEKSLKNVVKIKTDEIQDLLKAVQQVVFEAFQQYLPWTVVDSLESLSVIDVKMLTSDLNIGVCKAIVEHGKIGEVVQIVEKCNNSGRNRMMTVFFVVSDEGVYILDSSFGFLEKILLRDVVGVEYKDGVLEVKGKGEAVGFEVESGVAKRVNEIVDKGKKAGSEVF